MAYPSCLELVNLDASCDAIKKVGGVTSFVYFGSKKDFYNNFVATTYPQITYGTIDSVNYGWILGFRSLDITGQELARFEGVEYKNNAGFEAVPGENVNVFNHNLNLILYWKTQAELESLQNLLLNEDLFAIVATNSADIKIYGLERGKDYSPLESTMFTEKLGLKNLSASGADIVEIQGETGVSVSLQSINMLNAPYFLIGVDDKTDDIQYTTFAEIVAQLDLLSENN
jgi:hypothetical protein